MDTRVCSDLTDAGFLRPRSLLWKNTPHPRDFYAWLGLSHTAAPFEFSVDEGELDRLTRRSLTFKTLIDNAPDPVILDIPVVVTPPTDTIDIPTTQFEINGALSKRQRDKMAKRERLRLAPITDLVNRAQPTNVAAFGGVGRPFPVHLTSTALADLNQDEKAILNDPSAPLIPLINDSHNKPTIALHMSVFMCICRILIGDENDIYPTYSFAEFLEDRIGEFIHIANFLGSQYVLKWGLVNICTDANILKYIKLLNDVRLIPEKEWDSVRTALLEENSRLSTATWEALAGQNFTYPRGMNYKEIAINISNNARMEERFWREQSLVFGRTSARKCVFCRECVNQLPFLKEANDIVGDGTIDIMPCCYAPTHSGCLVKFMVRTWTCPHESIGKPVCDSIPICVDNGPPNPWSSYYYDRRERCPRCQLWHSQAKVVEILNDHALRAHVANIRANIPAARAMLYRTYKNQFIIQDLQSVAIEKHGVFLLPP